MANELREYNQNHSLLDYQYKDMIMKHKACQKDRFSEEWKQARVALTIKKLQRDIRATYKSRGNVNDLKSIVIELFNKYREISTDSPKMPPREEIPQYSNNDILYIVENIGGKHNANIKDEKKEHDLPNEEELEGSRTREHLQKTIEMLKRQITKDEAKRKQNGDKMVLENISLTT